jgi:hypothetical protein
MNRFVGVWLTTIVAVLAVTSASRAEVVVQTPVGTFVFGRMAPRCGPGVDVQVGGIVGVHVRPGPVVAPPISPDVALPIVPPSNVLPAPRPLDAPPPAVTLQDFAASFKPCPGTYEVCIVHPKTGEPVKVTFSLPEGSPSKVRMTRRELDFDYGKYRVAIRFRHDGSVSVSSN